MFSFQIFEKLFQNTTVTKHIITFPTILLEGLVNLLVTEYSLTCLLFFINKLFNVNNIIIKILP